MSDAVASSAAPKVIVTSAQVLEVWAPAVATVVVTVRMDQQPAA